LSGPFADFLVESREFCNVKKAMPQPPGHSVPNLGPCAIASSSSVLLPNPAGHRLLLLPTPGTSEVVAQGPFLAWGATTFLGNSGPKCPPNAPTSPPVVNNAREKKASSPAQCHLRRVSTAALAQLHSLVATCRTCGQICWRIVQANDGQSVEGIAIDLIGRLPTKTD
jgi:hypothetical protein